MVDYRPLGDEHRDAFFEYTTYAFSPDTGPVEYDPEEHDSERVRMGAQRGLFTDDDDRPRCLCAHYWFDALVRGEPHPAPGLSAVATPPEYRRTGYIEQLLTHSLEEYRSRESRFSLLWPFRTRFYRQFGWETCSSYQLYTCEPEALSFARKARNESESSENEETCYRQVDPDEYERLVPVYEEFSDRYTLSISRDEQWWRHRVFSSWTTDPYVYAYEREGEVRGYLVYSIEGEWSDRTMRVWELVFADNDALLALCGYCANHDSQVSEVAFSLPTDVDFLTVVPEPEDVECEQKVGAMARIVDVSETLSALQYPAVDAAVTLRVEDSFADWNDRTYRLVVDDGVATCEPVSAGREADVTLDVGALTQLAVGYRSVHELERSNRIERVDDGLSTLDRLFPSEQTFVGTRF